MLSYGWATITYFPKIAYLEQLLVFVRRTLSIVAHVRPAQRKGTVSKFRRFETCGKFKILCTETFNRLASNATNETEF